MIQFATPTKTTAQPALRFDIASTVERMVDKMLVCAMNGRTVDREVLGEDFSEAEIDEHWRAARDQARLRAVRKVA